MTRHSLSEVDGTTPTLEAVMGALADDRRRETLRYLLDRDGEGAVDVEELAEAVADEDDVESTHRSLHHAHLPRLVEAGIVVYDTREERVRLAGDQPAVEEFLEAADSPQN